MRLCAHIRHPMIIRVVIHSSLSKWLLSYDSRESNAYNRQDLDNSGIIDKVCACVKWKESRKYYVVIPLCLHAHSFDKINDHSVG